MAAKYNKTSHSLDCENDAFTTDTGSSPTCGWGTSTAVGWVRVPGSERAYFHYDVDVDHHATPPVSSS